MIYSISEKLYFQIIFVCSLLIIFSVYIIEFSFNIPPCKLCLYQRIPYFLIIFLSFFSLVLQWKDYSILANTVLFLTSALISLFHSLVERGFIEFEIGCTSSNKNFSNIEELRNYLNEVPLVKCDEIIFSFFGFSFANMNFIISLFFIFISVYVLIKNGRFF